MQSETAGLTALTTDPGITTHMDVQVPRRPNLRVFGHAFDRREATPMAESGESALYQI